MVEELEGFNDWEKVHNGEGDLEGAYRNYVLDIAEDDTSDVKSLLNYRTWALEMYQEFLNLMAEDVDGGVDVSEEELSGDEKAE